MERPSKVHWDNTKRLSLLYFKNSEPSYFDMRGGICWPTLVTGMGAPDVYGYALMCGYEVSTQLIKVFEQRRFEVVETILDPETNAMRYQGIAMWFNDTWARYQGRRYYYHQDHATTKKYILEIKRLGSIEPKPVFIDTPWGEDGSAQSIVWHRIKTGKVKIERDSDLMRDLGAARLEEKEVIPTVHALQCCLAGFERVPYRASHTEEG